MKKENEKKFKKPKKKKRSFRHIKQSDRDRLQAMLDAGHTQEQASEVLGFTAGAISREISEFQTEDGRYIASVAQHKANVRRSRSKSQGMKIESLPAVRDYIISEMSGPFHRSPDEIAGRMKMEGWTERVSARCIYRWLHSRWGQRYCKYLCTKRYKPKKQKEDKTKKEMIPDRVPIHLRPIEGIHAEGDLFVSPTKSETQKSGALITIPETKLISCSFIENKKPASMRQAVRKMTSEINVDDLTLDNGQENREHKRFGLPAYFCDPYSPWQKPHVENSIGLLRRWFIPKKTDLKTVSEEQLQEYIFTLNGKYRKSLGYRSAYEVSLERGIIRKTPVFAGGINIQKVAFQVKI